MAQVPPTDYEMKKQAMDQTNVEAFTKTGSSVVVAGAKDDKSALTVPAVGLTVPSHKETAKEKWMREKTEAKWQKPAQTAPTTTPADPADPWGLKKSEAQPSEADMQKPLFVPPVKTEESGVPTDKMPVESSNTKPESAGMNWTALWPVAVVVVGLLLLS